MLLATGHYARIDRTRGGVRLMRGVDASKDQSYFLASVSEGATPLFLWGDAQDGGS